MINRLIIFLVLLCSFCTVCVADIVESKAYQFYFDAPSSWSTIKRNADGREYQFNSPSGLSSISIEAFVNLDGMSLARLKQPISTSYTDDWMIKFDRKGTDDEKRNAHVKDSALTVYSRYETNDLGQRTEIIVGYYFFVTGNYGYVLKLRAPTSEWLRVQDSLKQVVSTFGHGMYHGLESSLGSLPEAYRYGWEGFSGRPSQTFFSDMVVSTATVYQSFWSVPQAFKRFSKSFSPVMDDLGFYVFDGQAVKGFFSDDGKLMFEFAYKGSLACPLVVSNHVLYITKITKNGTSLTAFSVDTQTALFSLDLPNKVSSVTVSSGYLYVLHPEGLILYDAVSGALLKQRSMTLSSALSPVLLDGFLCIATPGNLVCLDAQSLEKRWEITDVSKMVMLAADDGQLFVQYDTSRLKAFQIKSGEQNWQSDVGSLGVLPGMAVSGR